MPIQGSPSVSVSGDGLLNGMIISEGMKSYPQSEWSDRSNAFRGAVGREQSAAPAMDAIDRQRVARATRKLGGPDNSEVQITVRKMGQRESIEVVSGSEIKRFSIDMQSGNFDQLQQTIREVVRAIGQVAKQADLKKRVVNARSSKQRRV